MAQIYKLKELTKVEYSQLDFVAPEDRKDFVLGSSIRFDTLKMLCESNYFDVCINLALGCSIVQGYDIEKGNDLIPVKVVCKALAAALVHEYGASAFGSCAVIHFVQKLLIGYFDKGVEVLGGAKEEYKARFMPSVLSYTSHRSDILCYQNQINVNAQITGILSAED